jgi:uncharacterized protein YegJ (DUF2314 family)
VSTPSTFGSHAREYEDILSQLVQSDQITGGKYTLATMMNTMTKREQDGLSEQAPTFA